MTKGTIYKIEKFASTDGPGIRMVMFLKGCPLHCKWCSSPESQCIRPEMVYLRKDCVGCGKCVAVCPQNAISVQDGITVTDHSKCVHCGRCAEACLLNARRMIGYEVTVEEALREISKDSIFYFNSGGGVTLSGGEVTSQPQFAKEVLQGCCEVGIHTAIETCAFAKWEDMAPILEYVGRAYVDVKCVDSAKHKALTGVDNTVILANIRKMAQIEGLELVPRVPVIPGYNDAPEDWDDLVEFLQSLERFHHLELLPYHRYGIHMYQAMDRAYELEAVETPNDAYMSAILDRVSQYGFPVQIGG